MNRLISVALTADDWEIIVEMLEDAEDISTGPKTSKRRMLTDEILCQVGAEEERIEEYERARDI
ncbi:MAG: hypothetical protein DMF62_02330 [Acidobacteria bacterium]|nr:MAG: hypothetical protein DMF62_02330 [Acidobacteriota bacterium]